METSKFSVAFILWMTINDTKIKISSPILHSSLDKKFRCQRLLLIIMEPKLNNPIKLKIKFTEKTLKNSFNNNTPKIINKNKNTSL